MKHLSKFLTILLLMNFFVACSNGEKTKETKNQTEKENKKLIENLTGNYVSEEYKKRNEGYDWIAVSIKKMDDKTAHISIRSRADKKRPTCTFDADASLIDENTLKANVENSVIVFSFKDKKLTISSEKGENKLNFYCSGGASLAGIYTKINEQLDQKQIDKTLFRKSLSYGKYFFEVASLGNKITIQSVGLDVDNKKVTHERKGKVINAEIGDLNSDGYPEILVYLSNKDLYGNVIGYSVNNGKSMSQIYFPNIKENPKANKVFLGQDEFAIIETTFAQRFPIFEGNKKTEKMRQIQYKLKDGEACRKFVVDKIIEF